MAPETLAPEVEGILFPEIESTDYCDACGTEKSQAVHIAYNPTKNISVTFCAHHATKNAEALKNQGFLINPPANPIPKLR